MTRAELARKSGLLLDTNLLVLLVIGQYDPKRINGHKRLQSYTSEDYDLLLGFMSLFRTFATTPNILTEVSNLRVFQTTPDGQEYTAWIAVDYQSFCDLASFRNQSHTRFSVQALADSTLITISYADMQGSIDVYPLH
ncbi:MAG: hypothetical protein LH609_10485 [Rudanella sp.]|nr:hypothetical protein [Rudanella sp.]